MVNGSELAHYKILSTIAVDFINTDQASSLSTAADLIQNSHFISLL